MIEALSRKGIHAVDVNQSAVTENSLLSNAPFKLVSILHHTHTNTHTCLFSLTTCKIASGHSFKVLVCFLSQFVKLKFRNIKKQTA